MRLRRVEGRRVRRHVYLVCSVGWYPHGAGIYSANDFWTFVSVEPALTWWTTPYDDCGGCNGVSVERMAVPIDGVGTLVMVNASVSNDVWWQSATGNFQASTPGQGAKNTWNQIGTYTLPWSARTRDATSTDAEGLVLVGGWCG